MAIFHEQTVNFDVNPPLPEGSHAVLKVSPIPLSQRGFNVPAEISTASVFRRPPLSLPLFSTVVTAHFDTGATFTAIDYKPCKISKFVAARTDRAEYGCRATSCTCFCR